MHANSVPDEHWDIDVLHRIGQRIAAADPLSAVLKLVVEVVSSVVKCDSCFVYVLEGNDLILRASQNPHAHSRREIRLISTIGFLVGPEIESVRLEAENSKSFEPPEARQSVESAKSILRRNLQIDEEQAQLVLQNESQERRKSIKEIAEAILIADEIASSQKRFRSC